MAAGAAQAVMRVRVLAAAVLAIALAASMQSASAQVDSLIVERDVCPEYCVSGTQVAQANLAVLDRDSEYGRVVALVCPDEQFEIVGSIQHHRPPGIAVVRRRIVPYVETAGTDSILVLVPGDTVAVLSNHGEGYWSILAHGKRVVVPSFWPTLNQYPMDRDSAAAELVRPPHTHIWYRVRLANGIEGWILGHYADFVSKEEHEAERGRLGWEPYDVRC